ncbi:DUF6325 family protein [Actinoplanes sp. NPDC048791]|uniref:DUF6325 family protein n=1 Tax=Actinoplanes sp. NPDC048791 TaxID=3154623 RepID=UPI0033C65C65
MAMGPLELVVLSFPAERFSDGARAALRHLPTEGEMTVVDVVVVRTDVAGRARAVELSEVPGLRSLTGLTGGLITQVDVAEVAELVRDGTQALAVLLEHRWLHDLYSPLAVSQGRIVALTHISGAPVAAGS